MPRRLAALAAALLIGPVPPARAADPAAEFFEAKIRPLLADNCLKCHGDAKPKGGLKLTSRATVLAGGDSGPAVVPGDPAGSLLVGAIGYAGEIKMPPRQKLSDSQIADLTAWVKAGAVWPDAGSAVTGPAGTFDLAERKKHWSFQPILAVPPPAVKDAGWAGSPVDRFILAKLEAKGLKPAPPADKRALLRRVTFDLTGLPPTPEEIDAFLKDDSPGAFARVVDRLLASHAYGERWARHWMDLVRYAETCGHEFDPDLPQAFEYRDYLIRALNADLPYDRFVTEHVAGDLLPEPRRHPTERFNESIIATGFWYLGEAKHSPVDVRGDEADRIDNQIDVFGKTFLGLTLACARCHDHKFDAIPQKDYYALCGYLQSSRFQRAFIDDPTPRAEALQRLTRIRAELDAAARDAAADAIVARAELSPGLTSLRDLAKAPDEAFAARKRDLLAGWKADAARNRAGSDGAVVFADFASGTYADWYVTGEAFGAAPAPAGTPLTSNGLPTALLTKPAAHGGAISPKLQGAIRSRSFVIEKDRIWFRLAGRGARLNVILDGLRLIQDPIYGGLKVDIGHGDHFVWHPMDVRMWKGHTAYIELLDDGDGWAALDRVVFADSPQPPDAPNPLLVRMLEDESVDSPAKLADRLRSLTREVAEQWRAGDLPKQPDAADRFALLNAVLPGDGEKSAPKKLAELAQALAAGAANLPAPRRAMAMADGTGEDERLFIRGSHKNLGPVVPRRFLEALAGAEQPAPKEGSGRLELAKRLLDPSNPLPARVMANRLWHHHFGTGIVPSPDDFGKLGTTPTHPELLDWLAAELVRNGWSLKSLHRTILLSNAYQMSSRPDAAADAADPRNELWHRYPVRRLEAEAIRDAMLSASGRLDRTMYGPGVPPHLTPFMDGRGRPGSSGPLDGNGRRSVYLGVRRNFLPPMFMAFDYPVPFSSMGRRGVSNVPAQALALLNNPFVVQQAELWARRELAGSKSAERRVESMYERAFGRPPTDGERAEALAFVRSQAAAYGCNADDVKPWADLGHVLFNVKEFIYLN